MADRRSVNPSDRNTLSFQRMLILPWFVCRCIPKFAGAGSPMAARFPSPSLSLALSSPLAFEKLTLIYSSPSPNFGCFCRLSTKMLIVQVKVKIIPEGCSLRMNRMERRWDIKWKKELELENMTGESCPLTSFLMRNILKSFTIVAEMLRKTDRIWQEQPTVLSRKILTFFPNRGLLERTPNPLAKMR